MFDFVVCSHTLEDIPNPFVVCEELQRVAKAGYLETPARVVEQTRGERGQTGSAHHHWMVEMQANQVRFTAKPAGLGRVPGAWVPRCYTHRLPAARKVTWLFWEGRFAWEQRQPPDPHLDARAFVRSLGIPRWHYGREFLGDLKRWLVARTSKPRPAPAGVWDAETLFKVSKVDPAGTAAQALTGLRTEAE